MFKSHPLDHVCQFEPIHGEAGMFFAIGERFGTVQVARYDARGVERVWKSIPLSGVPQEVLASDMDGDGLDDAILCRTGIVLEEFVPAEEMLVYESDDPSTEDHALISWTPSFDDMPDLEPRPQSVVFVVDVSGSMAGQKIVELQSALSHVLGSLTEIKIFSTILTTPDNKQIIVPNAKMTGDNIINYSAKDVRRVDMVFGIGYGDNIPNAEKVLTEIVTSHDKVLKDPAPVVRLHTLNESSVDFIVRPWVNKDDYWDVYWDITRTVKMRFDEEKISIPFPQRDVHLHHKESPGEG